MPAPNYFGWTDDRAAMRWEKHKARALAAELKPQIDDFGCVSEPDELEQHSDLELDVLLKAVRPFFSPDMYVKWLTSVPDGKLFDYALHELQACLCEFYEPADEREQQAAECQTIEDWLQPADRAALAYGDADIKELQAPEIRDGVSSPEWWQAQKPIPW